MTFSRGLLGVLKTDESRHDLEGREGIDGSIAVRIAIIIKVKKHNLMHVSSIKKRGDDTSLLRTIARPRASPGSAVCPAVCPRISPTSKLPGTFSL